MDTHRTNGQPAESQGDGIDQDGGRAIVVPDARWKRADDRIAKLEEDLQGYRYYLKNYLNVDADCFLRQPEKALERAGVSFHSNLKGGGWNEKETLPFRTAADISEEGISPTEYLIPNLLPVGALGLLTGIAKGGGKTTFAAHIARALIHGDSFLGESTQPTPLVYLTEQSASAFHNEYLKPVGLHESADLHLLHGYEVGGVD